MPWLARPGERRKTATAPHQRVRQVPRASAPDPRSRRTPERELPDAGLEPAGRASCSRPAAVRRRPRNHHRLCQPRERTARRPTGQRRSGDETLSAGRNPF